MRKQSLLLFACMLLATGLCAQSSARVCVRFDSTFRELKAGSLNFWVQGGLLMTGRSRDARLYNSLGFNLHYVPVNYLQTGLNLTKRLPVADGVNFWKSYELSAFARYSFLRMDCAKMGVYGHGGYTWVVNVQKRDGGKTEDGFAFGGIGMYKSLGKAFTVQFENELYFGQRPSQVSLNLVWRFMNMRFKQ